LEGNPSLPLPFPPLPNHPPNTIRNTYRMEGWMGCYVDRK